MEVSRLADRSGDYPAAMKEFIDHLIRVTDWRHGRPVVPSAVYDDEPDVPLNFVLRAHLGGMSEHLSFLANRPAPSWSEKPIYFLNRPHYVGGARSRPFLIDLTPRAFSRRLLFCGPVLEKLTLSVAERGKALSPDKPKSAGL
jgi:hypothetical protein